MGELKIPAISFYSLKGGTGRSLALANTAYAMAQMGKNVLCLDMDIEAPGLIDLFGINEDEVKISTMDLLNNGGERIFEILSNSYTDPVIDMGEKWDDRTLEGKLYLIPALRASASEIMETVDDKVSYTTDYTNDEIREALNKLAIVLGLNYILIDSRSGVSKEAFYTLFLSNYKIVLNTRIDRQGRLGIEYVYNVLKNAFSQFGKDTMLVASNVPTDAEEEVGRIIKEIENKVNDKISLIIPHDSRLMLNEEIVVKTRPQSEIAKKFIELAKILIGEV